MTKLEFHIKGPESLEDLINWWLSQKHTTLWADFEIAHPERRKLAADWFADQIRDLCESTN